MVSVGLLGSIVAVTLQTRQGDKVRLDNLPHGATVAVEQSLDLTGVDDVESNHDDDHEQSVKDVVGPLVGEQVSILTGSVFDQTEDATDEDQGGCDVDVDQVLLPWHRWVLHHLLRGFAGDAHVEDEGNDDEEGEEDDLDHETDDEDLLARVGCADAVGGEESGTCERRVELVCVREIWRYR